MVLNQKGMSLIEVTVSVLILGIVAFPLIDMFRTGSVYTAAARHEVTALNFAGAIMEEIKSIPGNQTGFVRGAAANTITLENRSSAADGFYNNFNIAICGGTGAGQVKKITGYDGDLRLATTDSDWLTVPDYASSYIIFGYCPGNYPIAVAVGDGTDTLKTIRVTAYYSANKQKKEISLTAEKLKR
jgi:prepilin-type N-terminal cleavage/methylation domain-containing protein